MKGWLISLVCVLGAVTVPAATPEADADASVQDVLEEAREKLDEAAGEFAEHVVAYVGEVDWRQWANRPFLGIIVAHQDAEGIRVASVTPGGGAEDAGVRAEDVIVRVNDADLTGSPAPIMLLYETLDDVEAGDSVKVEVLRDGKSLAIDVVPQPGAMGRRWRMTPAIPLTPLMDNLPGWTERRRAQAFGFKLVDIGETLGAYFGVDGGVLVLTADDESELLPGDIVLGVGGDDVTDADAAYLAFADAEEPTKVALRRNGKRKTLTVEPIEGVKVRKSIEYTE